MSTLSLLSPAKLNLFLLITGQRSDGYHELQTLFQLLDHGDQIDFRQRDDGQIRLTTHMEGVSEQDNLIIKAANLLAPYRTNRHLGVDISIAKKLPMGGGIGGGSSNAATTLLALNQLWKLDMDLEELSDLGLQLGADVPVFIRGHSAWAEGIGDQLQPIDIPETWYLVIKPACNVSTAKIFSSKQLTRNSSPIKIAAFFEQGAGNDCEPLVRELYPEIDSALNWLSQFAKAQLTGTGACVFAQFESQGAAQAVMDKLPATLEGFVAKGVNSSPTHQQLNIKL